MTICYVVMMQCIEVSTVRRRILPARSRGRRRHVSWGWAAALLSTVGCTASNELPAASGPARLADVKPHDESRQPRIAPLISVHGPTPRPDRVILSWADDPSRTQAVTWRTDSTVFAGLAEIAVAGDNGQFAKRARQLKSRTSLLTTDVGKSHYHSVEFAALTPATKYAYRVGDGTNWTEWFHFVTASDQPLPFSFVYFGDAQTDLKSLWSRVIREAFANAPDAKFFLHAGDLVNDSNRDAEWGEWFQAGGWLNAMIPSVACPGNHEYQKFGTGLSMSLTDYWRPQFTFPTNGPPHLSETVYYLDYQGVRIVSLNSNERTAEQAAWLDRLLQDNPCRWTIVTCHHPIYSAARARDNAVLRSQWQPIFDKHHVHLVLQGHDHAYARTGLVNAESTETKTSNSSTSLTVRGRTGGTVYVVSVSGPKMYDLDSSTLTEFRRSAEDVQLFQIVSIDGDELRYQARTAVGTLYDGFTLRQSRGGEIEIIEQVPETPQRRRELLKPTVPVSTPPPHRD